MSKISPLAYVDPEAKIGENCEIGPFCYIDKNVEIGADNILMNSVTILSGTRMGNGNTVFPGAVLGAVPQDLKFKGEDTTAIIGDGNRIRENVTINRGTAAKGRTKVGSNNLLMEGVHIAHDVTMGSNCIIGNTTKVAGEVTIDDTAIISACVLIHQFCRVGSLVMIGGGTRFSQDAPPFAMIAREPCSYCGLNIVGLRRHGYTNEQIEIIRQTYRIIYEEKLLLKDACAKIRKEVPQIKEVQYILSFIESSKRGFIH